MENIPCVGTVYVNKGLLMFKARIRLGTSICVQWSGVVEGQDTGSAVNKMETTGCTLLARSRS